MKLTIHEHVQQQEDEIIIRCHKVDAKLQHLIHYIRQYTGSVEGKIQNKLYQIPLEDIYYMDCVDGKTFLYTEEEVYESKVRLSTLEKHLKQTSFVRVSKNCILNSLYLQSVCSLWNHRMEATLANGEKVIITRHYIKSLKEYLEKGRFSNV